MRFSSAIFVLSSAALLACDADIDIDADLDDGDEDVVAGDTGEDTSAGTDGVNYEPYPGDLSPESALIRVAHMSPDTANASFLVDDGVTTGFYGNTFSSATDYAVVDEIGHTYDIDTVYTGDMDEVVTSIDGLQLEASTFNTIVLMGTVEDGDVMLLPIKEERSEPEAGKYRLHIIHAAAGDDFRSIDIWDVTDPKAPELMADDVELGAVLPTDLDASERNICVDTDDDASCDALFPLPLLSAAGFYNLYITNNNQGVPFSVLQFESGTTAYINTESNPI